MRAVDRRLSDPGSREIASNVWPAREKTSDWSFASGDTTRAASPSLRKKRPELGIGSASLRTTGSSRWKTRGRSAIACVQVAAAAGQRVAESPQVLLHAATRWWIVGAVEVVHLHRHLGGGGREHVPVPHRRVDLPRSSSSSFSPSGERGRMVNVVSSGRSATFSSSLMSNSATALPSGPGTVRTFLTNPPGTRPRAPRRRGPTAARWSDLHVERGHERQPAVRVVGQQTAITTTSTVTEPTNTGLATIEVLGRLVIPSVVEEGGHVAGGRGRAGAAPRAGPRGWAAEELPAASVARGPRAFRRAVAVTCYPFPVTPLASLRACGSRSGSAVGSATVTPNCFGPSQLRQSS